MIDRIIVPDLGATGGNVVVTEWLVKDDQHVKAGTPLFVGRNRQGDPPGRGISRRLSFAGGSSPRERPSPSATRSRSSPTPSMSRSRTLSRLRSLMGAGTPPGPACPPRKEPCMRYLQSRSQRCRRPGPSRGRSRGTCATPPAMDLDPSPRADQLVETLSADVADPALRGSPVSALSPGARAGHPAPVPGAGGSRGRRMCGARVSTT